MTQTWYYARNGNRYGPVSPEALRQLAQEGGLKPEDLVWREGLDDWVPAARLKGVFPSSAPSPLSPPPLPQAAPQASACPTQVAVIPEPPQATDAGRPHMNRRAIRLILIVSVGLLGARWIIVSALQSGNAEYCIGYFIGRFVGLAIAIEVGAVVGATILGWSMQFVAKLKLPYRGLYWLELTAGTVTATVGSLAGLPAALLFAIPIEGLICGLLVKRPTGGEIGAGKGMLIALVRSIIGLLILGIVVGCYAVVVAVADLAV